MEKLVELLNEYGVLDWSLYGEELILDGADNNEVSDFLPMYIISKQFGFIERLVKNHHIDYSAVDTQNWNNLQEELDCRLSDKFIMYLSIQGNPLEYLCSILKE